MVKEFEMSDLGDMQYFLGMQVQQSSSYIFITQSKYVDDMLIAGSNMQDINVLKRKLSSTFSIKDSGDAKQILEMRITRDRKKQKLIFFLRVIMLRKY